MIRYLFVLAVYLFSLSAHASAVCSSVAGSWSGTVQLTTIPVPSGGMSSCPMVYFTGEDYATYAATPTTTASEFDPVLFEKSFSAALVLFVTGLGIGLIISILRKMKN